MWLCMKEKACRWESSSWEAVARRGRRSTHGITLGWVEEAVQTKIMSAAKNMTKNSTCRGPFDDSVAATDDAERYTEPWNSSGATVLLI